jgi:hypothetical protein
MGEKEQKNAGKPEMAPESTACSPILGQGYVIGHVEDINGEGAILVNWQPTRAELRVLGLHYLEVYYSHQIEFVELGATGSTEWRESAFAWHRFNSIADAIGEGAVVPEWDAYIEEQERLLSEINQVSGNGVDDVGEVGESKGEREEGESI